MSAIGICRIKAEETGAEYVTVKYRTTSQLSNITRALYEKRGYRPLFDELPPCDAAHHDYV